MSRVTDEELECLAWFEPYTLMRHEDMTLLRALRDLCETYGYGRVPQMAAWIETIWRDRDSIADFEAHKAELQRLMAEHRALTEEAP